MQESSIENLLTVPLSSNISSEFYFFFTLKYPGKSGGGTVQSKKRTHRRKTHITKTETLATLVKKELTPNIFVLPQVSMTNWLGGGEVMCKKVLEYPYLHPTSKFSFFLILVNKSYYIFDPVNGKFLSYKTKMSEIFIFSYFLC